MLHFNDSALPPPWFSRPRFPVPSEGALQGILNETAARLEDAAAGDEGDEDEGDEDDEDDGNLAAGRPYAGGGGNPIIISLWFYNKSNVLWSIVL